QARQYPGQERQFLEFVQQNAQMQQQIRAPLFEDKVVDYILELAQVSDKEVSKADLEKAVEELDDA
ncbi:MAG: trigger factor, partial [Pseudomonadota bacterium]